jgi:hypothetical protein
MPKVIMLTNSADADKVLHEGRLYDLPKEEATELITGGFARSAGASESATIAPGEKATGRRGKQQTVSGEEDA